MRLYHYTTFANFCSIWIEKKLRFSTWTNCNDVYEREKTYNLSQNTKEYNGKKFSAEVVHLFVKNVFEEVERYKQISFTKDYKNMKGYESPMMWGHYARDYQRSGVCIEIDSLKIKLGNESGKVYKGAVKYRSKLTATDICGVDEEKNDAAEEFVVKNRKQLFFQKHPHWKPENEYRYISKNCDYLDLSSGAITSVYVLGRDDVTLQSVKHIISNSGMISFLKIGGLKSLGLKDTNLLEYEQMIEEVRYFNEHPEALFGSNNPSGE